MVHNDSWFSATFTYIVFTLHICFLCISPCFGRIESFCIFFCHCAPLPLFIQIFFIDIVFNKLSTLLAILSVSTCVGSYHKDNRNFCAVSHKGLATCSASTTPVVNSMYSTDAVSNPSMIGSLSVLSNLSHSLAVSSVNIIQL